MLVVFAGWGEFEFFLRIYGVFRFFRKMLYFLFFGGSCRFFRFIVARETRFSVGSGGVDRVIV